MKICNFLKRHTPDKIGIFLAFLRNGNRYLYKTWQKFSPHRSGYFWHQRFGCKLTYTIDIPQIIKIFIFLKITHYNLAEKWSKNLTILFLLQKYLYYIRINLCMCMLYLNQDRESHLRIIIVINGGHLLQIPSCSKWTFFWSETKLRSNKSSNLLHHEIAGLESRPENKGIL